MTDDMTGGINLSKLWVLCSVFCGVSKEAGGGSLINRAFPFVFGTGFYPFITFSPLIVKLVVKDATPVLFRCMPSDILTLGLVERHLLKYVALGFVGKGVFCLLSHLDTKVCLIDMNS